MGLQKPLISVLIVSCNCIFISIAQNPLVYTAVSPKVFQANSPYNILISIEDGGSPATVSCSIISSSQTFSSQETEILAGTSKSIAINVKTLPLDTNEKYELKILLDASGTKYENSTSIIADKKHLKILLQTDKPIYKPGETVKFRVIGLNQQLRPQDFQQLDIFIKDPQQNVIKHWAEAQTGLTGILSSSLTLSPEPILGTWKLEVKSSNPELNVETTFQVNQYVLPKFKVEVKLPKFATFANSKVQAEIKATYTYGKGVKGQAVVTLPEYSGSEDFLRYPGIGYGGGVSKTLDIDGSVFVEFDLAKDLVQKDVDIQYFNINYDNIKDFVVLASVTETITGRKQNASARIKLYKHAFKIQLLRKPEYNIPGLPLKWAVKVSTHDDIPISDDRPDALIVSFQNPTPIVHLMENNTRVRRSPHKNPVKKNGRSFKNTAWFQTPAGHKRGRSVSPPKRHVIRPPPPPPPPHNHPEKPLSFKKYPIPGNGTVEIIFENNDPTVHLNKIFISYKNLTETFYLPGKRSNPNKFINIGLENDYPEEGDILEAIIIASKPIKFFHYILLTGNTVLKSKSVSTPEAVSKHRLSIPLPKGTGQKCRIVVYTLLSPNNEVVADTLKFDVTGTVEVGLENYLNLSLSKNNTEPGTNVTIAMSSTKKSVVALRGVDQSVLVLQEDKDITMNVLDDVRKSFVTIPARIPHRWGGSTALRIFEDANLVIITNGYMEKEHNPMMFVRKNVNMRPMAMGFKSSKVARSEHVAPQMNMMAKASAPIMLDDAAPFVALPPPRVRKDFPETWLWEEIENSEGQVNLSRTVPDTITSWVITGFSLSPDTGIGVSLTPTVLETFRPFFISLNVPYSIVKGEILTLQVLVHNYLNTEITVDVTFDNMEGKFEFPGETDPMATSQTRNVTVKPADVVSVPFVIKAKVFGTLKLNVKAVAPMAGDAVSQPLIVKPPGHKQMKNQGVLLDLRPESVNNSTTSNLNLTAWFPNVRVEGADSVRISVIGEILGSTIANLDKLLQMPCGCGEQNMLNFVPDIVILDYLTASGSLTPAVKNKAIGFLESGYQRELTYRHSDGSFSAFGQSDSSGSTWLTAFVVKSFVHAKPYITVDQKIIDAGLEFLTQQQTPEGRFKEPGKIIHSDMQGGSSSGGVALCAYVLLAFLEISKKTPKYSEIIDKGLKFITESSNPNDPYEINLITYTLHLANHSKKEEFFILMEKHATFNGGQKHWEGKQSEEKEPHPVMNKFWSTPAVRPVAVEMTSYALMTYLLRSQLSDALGIGKWLLQQRNAEGGFLSTQDTVVGLAALAEFAKLASSKETAMKIEAKYVGGSQSFEVNKENRMVLQELYLSNEVRWVNFDVKGKGTALAQLSWFYYVEDKPNQPAFLIDIETGSSNHSNLDLHICTSYIFEINSTLTNGSKSNMVVMEVNLPSGYAFETDSLTGIKKGKVMRFELENADSKLNIYFESLEVVNVCVDLSANRLHQIGNPAKAFVIVYDYYDITKKSRAFYEPPKVPDCDICTSG